MSLDYRSDELPPEEQDPGLIYAGTGVPYYTYLLCAAIVIVAVLQFTLGLERSIDLAGFNKQAFMRLHEFWRIITGATLHGSLAHILMNTFALYSFGRIFEMLSGRAHLAIVFLLSVLGGGILSMAFSQFGTSVGASGGIVGLVSYLAVYAFRRRKFISDDFRRSLVINIGFIIVFGLILFQVVDNYAHIGGLLTGAVYGLLQIPKDEFVDPRVTRSSTELVGLICLGIYLAGCVFSGLLMWGVV